MAADASAYAVLGLEPGSDWTAVERAYKTLMKTHHPDRPGGDGGRAAEINHAYRELRRARAAYEEDARTWEGYAPVPDHPRKAARWPMAALGIVGVAGLAILLTAPSDGLVAGFRTRSAPPAAESGRRAQIAAAPDLMARPLNGGAIRAGVTEAARLAAARDDAAMTEATRRCSGEQRLQPSLATLDRCAAFDDAIVQLEDRDPWRDDGPFSQVAVTGRQSSAANLLSDDYLAIDARLDRIRLAVELALAQPDPAAETPVKPSY